jgi:hypothetical protein
MLHDLQKGIAFMKVILAYGRERLLCWLVTYTSGQLHICFRIGPHDTRFSSSWHRHFPEIPMDE